MRNLKKVLSLALALVMLLGMMVIGASAAETTYADLTDNGEIKNVEAVSLMVDLGIIKGVEQEDGTFKYLPADTVNRATMAKLVYYIQLGDTDPAMFENMDAGLEDVEGHWAKGYINYCYSVGLISGDGLGHFMPDEPVNVVGAAKMLLVALGYDANNRKYQNDANWSVNIMLDAQRKGLTAGLKNAAAVAPLSRDDAAQMVFNALNANTVVNEYSYTADGTAYISKVTDGTDTLGFSTYDMVKVTATVSSINDKGEATLTGVTPSVDGVTVPAKVLADAKLTATPDMVGGTATFYVAVNSAKAATKVISSALVPGGSNVLYTGMDGSNLNALTVQSPGNNKFVAVLNKNDSDAETVAYYLNGAVSDKTAVNTAIDKKGTIVELIDTDNDGDIDVVKAIEKTVAELASDPVVRNDKVTIGALGIAAADVDNVVGFEDLKKGDVVLYYKTGDVTYIEKAASFEGVVSGNKTVRGTAYAVIDGKDYEASELGWSGSTANQYSTVSDTKTYTFYTDNAGYLVAKVEVKDDNAPSPEGQILVVKDVAWVTETGTGAFGSTSKNYVQAQIVKTDGSTEIVTVASVNGVKFVPKDTKLIDDLGYEASTLNSGSYQSGHAMQEVTTLTAAGEAFGTAAKIEAASVVGSGKYVKVTKDGTAATKVVDGVYFGVTNKSTLTASDAPFALKTFYNYELNRDGSYKLTTMTNNAISSVVTGNTIAFVTGAVGNANTVFIYGTADRDGAYTYQVYTGIANVPTTKASVTGAYINAQGGSIASYVFADLGQNGTSTASSDLVYTLNTNTTSLTSAPGQPATYTAEVLLNGEKTTITLDKNVIATADANNYGARTLYEVDSISNDVYTLTAASGTKTGIKNVDGNVLVAATSDTWTYEDGAPAYVVDERGEVAVMTIETIELDGNDKIDVVADNGKAIAAYVTKVSNEATKVDLKNATNQGFGTATNSVLVLQGTGKPADPADIKLDGYTTATGSEKTNVKIEVTAASGTSVKSMSLNGTDVTGDEGTENVKDDVAVRVGENTLVVVIADSNKGPDQYFTYKFTVNAAP